MTGISVKPPSECTAGELDDFFSLITLRNEINPQTLEKRIRKALFLGFFYKDDHLLGIVALKKASKKYIASLISLLGKPLPSRMEVGWAYTRPEYRGRGISNRLLAGLLETCGRRDVFAVTRVGNDAAERILLNHGFRPYGPRILWKGYESRVYT